MKTRITALILIAVMLLILLSGCGAAEATPERTTAPETEVPTTEPVTAPTTEPTEPPTALEEMGYELWEGASSIYTYGAPNMYGVELPISRGLGGKYPDHKAYFYIKEEAGRLLEDLVAAPVDVQVYEFPASSFDDDIDWMKETMKPFYQYCKKQDSGDYSFTEWINANQDKKLLWMTSTVQVDIIKCWIQAREESFGKSSSSVGVRGPELVSLATGKRFSPTVNYDAQNKPMVGQCAMEMDGKEAEILMFYTLGDSGWHGEYGTKINVLWNVYVLLPAEFEDICFVMPEYASVEAYKEKKEPETDALWETGNILEDYDTEKYNYYFYSLYSKPE